MLCGECMINRRTIVASVASATSILVAGCAASSDRYPSLAIREAERVEGSFQVSATPLPGPTPVSETTLSRVQQLVGDARAAHEQFLTSASSAERSVRSAIGSDATSNAWASAQVDLADLDSHRSIAAIALGDLDLLYVDSTISFSERDEIDAARKTVVGMISEEDAILARLRGDLAR